MDEHGRLTRILLLAGLATSSAFAFCPRQALECYNGPVVILPPGTMFFGQPASFWYCNGNTKQMGGLAPPGAIANTGDFTNDGTTHCGTAWVGTQTYVQPDGSVVRVFDRAVGPCGGPPVNECFIVRKERQETQTAESIH